MTLRRVGLVVLVLWAELALAQFRPITKVLHVNETGNVNGDTLTIDGASSVSLTVTISGTATVSFEATQNRTTWSPVACIEVGDAAYISILETTATMTVRCNVAGLVEFRAPTSGNSGTVNVTATASPAVMGSGGGGSGGGAAVTLETAKTNGRVVTSATSAAPVEIGNGTQGFEAGGDATLGGFIRPKPLGDTNWNIWPNFEGCIKDLEAVATMLCFNPDGATAKDKYPLKPGYYFLKSVYLSAWSLYGDGTNCPSRPTVVTISNQQYASFICTENNSSRLKFSLPMRTNWDGGVIYIKPHYAQTAADTGSVALEVAAACRAFGTAFNGTYGTEVDVDDAVLVGSGAIESTLSAAVTPNGTCAAGDILFVYIDVDATDNPTTAAATLNFIGAEIFWSETSMSH